MKTINLMAAVAMMMGSTGAAFAGDATTTTDVQREEVSVAPESTNEGTGVQAYCYWETYCNVYGYCWTSWVCF